MSNANEQYKRRSQKDKERTGEKGNRESKGEEKRDYPE